MSNSANEVDEYLAGLPSETRAALERLRATIRAAAPDATEVISYRVPTFKHHGGLVGFAGFESHCSFFVMSPEVMEAHAEELEPYDTAKGTIRFAPDQPLPDAVVRKLVEARIKENEERSTRRRTSQAGG
jgi:uncharacterized protein YdhG (YjbR/CyaY superfamily)